MLNLQDELTKYFSFKRFRPGQEKILTMLLKGKNVLAILPTGGGKTLLYQLYAAITHQRIIIVSPLISLMQDQVSRLQFLGSKRVIALTSAIDFKERQFIMNHLEQYQFIYASPEMLANPQIMEKFKQLSVGLLVIDEAHCISEWGPDFRPDYLKLNQVRKSLKMPLTLMMTATATTKTRQDILERMEMDQDRVNQIVLSVNRKNIFLSARVCKNQREKDDLLVKLVSKLHGAGIIYFSSRATAETVAALLNHDTSKRVEAYHGGMEGQYRFRIQQQFMNNEIDIVCATSAFGMGIDKNDVRYVIHYHLPGNIQNYMQEIGRAGRDGKPSLAILLYEPNDRYLQANLIDNTYPEDNLISYLYQHPQVMKKNDAFRVVKYYYENHFSTDQAISFLNRSKEQRLTGLQQMYQYIFTPGCRRKVLLNHFDEQLVDDDHENQFCCDFHFNFWTKWEIFNDRYLKSSDFRQQNAVKDWHEVLKSLFLSKN
ncbi:RecQ family ATP-dependent DNA helicase [Lentilactobacillus hilgardii]|uniref:ATP-dependent DNA helicase RecQ n=1 Tax=Lentilactobacillus hilgardii TaxID=1588 RepID=A0A6P1E7A6_LENHI|nr:RecQ family ATP-dependent DNA helicase [Lentilactobacillus hilgardii]EEI70029.1 ATP-dependent DNA helicase, RecQ family [Lentilactobacillus hilgardii ATCC 27305]MCT3391860.1 ATP-dependent DNA helicase RecQ [Lentilactobacillus hilgardii]QHB52040.1 RecQ family ATP-dependent DNA helicase [Lentilactobacillus hilgardii]RRG11450.1 MAG: ATP-dependent DNA helicase RecQ [Lactobacillus sp.]